MNEEINETKVQVATDVGVIDPTAELDKALSEFRLMPDNAIPIPPTIGTRFEAFFEEGLQALSIRHKEWERNIKEFINDDAGTASSPKENLVRTSVESLVDYTYMRNPTAEISSTKKSDQPLAEVLQKLLKALMDKRTLPGINLRPKVLKQIIFAHLTNFGVLELTFQAEKGSYEQAFATNEKVKEAIKHETDPEKAERLYNLLDILQRELDVRGNAGFGVRVRSPFAHIVDPNCQELDLSDCRWWMDRDVMKIDFIRAEYTTYDEETGKYFLKYNPEVEFDLSGSQASSKVATEEAIINSIMPDVDTEQAKLRVKDTVPIVWVYDKTTRLKYLYMEGRWDVPLWVYEDEMKLSQFFPFFVLAFSAALSSIIQSGEVSHYIAYQEEINRINKQLSRMRSRGFSKYLYNSAVIDKEEVDKLFQLIDSGNDRLEAVGIKMKDQDKALSEILEPLKMPTAQFKEIFDKTDLKAALDKTTRISDAMSGAQFRTNTTNDAIDTYREFAANRLEGLTDKIELTVERLLWSLSELTVSVMPKETISEILTVEDAEKFNRMSVKEFNMKHTLVIAAGSIEKPTSSAKKKEAMQLIQMLGQFGTAAPRTVLTLVTRMLKSAFSKTLVTDEDIKKLEEEGLAAMSKGVSTPQQPQPQQTPEKSKG